MARQRNSEPGKPAFCWRIERRLLERVGLGVFAPCRMMRRRRSTGFSNLLRSPAVGRDTVSTNAGFGINKNTLFLGMIGLPLPPEAWVASHIIPYFPKGCAMPANAKLNPFGAESKLKSLAGEVSIFRLTG